MAKRILFQGDSITDCNRLRDVSEGRGPNYVPGLNMMGQGYAGFVRATLNMDEPGRYEFYNRGISGNRIVDIYARIKRDFINLKPDFASIYVGANDVWHEIMNQNGVDTPKFERIYTMLLDEVMAACPGIKLMLVAPFVLEGKCTCATPEMPDRLEWFQKGVAEKAAVVEKLAAKYCLPLVRLQPAFDEVCKRAPADYWVVDGVHPTPAGHELIKRQWLRTFRSVMG